jgi:hypothetical protein
LEASSLLGMNLSTIQASRLQRTALVALLLGCALGPLVWILVDPLDDSSGPTAEARAEVRAPDSEKSGRVNESVGISGNQVFGTERTRVLPQPRIGPAAESQAPIIDTTGRDANPSVQEPSDLLMIDPTGCHDVVVPASLYELTDGFLLIYHPNGRPAEFGRWDGWWRQGQWDCYDEDGNLTMSAHFVHGFAEGLSSLWYPNGMLASQAETRRGQFHGSRVHWNPDGSFNAELSGQYVDGVKID